MPNLSNAFEISRKVPLISYGGLQSKPLQISYVIGKSWETQKLPGMKQDCHPAVNSLFCIMG